MTDRPKFPDGSVVMDEHVTAEYVAQLAAEVERVRAEERERCARIADAMADRAKKQREKLALIGGHPTAEDVCTGKMTAAQKIAAAIREGGE